VGRSASIKLFNPKPSESRCDCHFTVNRGDVRSYDLIRVIKLGRAALRFKSRQEALTFLN
jgi:hypothetical protein